MVDQEKGEVGFELYELKDLEKRISVKKHGVYYESGRPGTPIYFSLLLESKIGKYSLSIKSIKYRVWCSFIPLQVVEWREEDKFASNGLEIRNISPLRPLDSVSPSLPFNTYICPKIPGENRWDLDGYIGFESPLGDFKREFSLQGIKLEEEDWKIIAHDKPAVTVKV